MSWFSKYNKTNFEAGGCKMGSIPMGAPVVKTNKKFYAPKKIDSRDMCLASSNQYKTPHCVGYGTAGYCEYYHWKKEHFPEQLNGDAIYAEAKKLDKQPNISGTWPRFGIQAAINLGFIKGKGEYVPSSILDIKFALHEYAVVIAGFKITNEWNQVEKKSGLIRDLGSNAVTRGGHCVLIVGYDATGIYIQNSWGAEWGIHGFAILPWHKVEKQLITAMVINQIV